MTVYAKLLTALISGLFFWTQVQARAQVRIDGGVTIVDGVVEFDKTIHDFGDFLLSSGPKECSFNVKNVSQRAMAILTVTSSCGCTNVTWTKAPVKPGESGTINATYSNDQGAFPFEKTLTVYVSSLSKPVILRLRGNVLEKKKPLAELYPLHLGPLALKDSVFKAGNLSQGGQKSDFAKVGNIGRSKILVEFVNVSDGLEVRLEPSEIAPDESARLVYTVTASRERWGKNWYFATPVVNGKNQSPIKIWAFTKEDFSGWSKEQKDNGSQPMFESSTYEFGLVERGTVVEAVFNLTNKGKGELVVYKIDCDTPGIISTIMKGCAKASPESTYPVVPAGGKAELRVKLDTSSLPNGKLDAIITLTTNAPLRPIVNLFLAGGIK